MHGSSNCFLYVWQVVCRLTYSAGCFTRPVHPETDFSHTTTHVADIGEEIVLVGPSPKVDLFNPAQKSWRELHYNSRNEMREEATITTLGSLLFVAGGQSYDDAHDMTGETMDVVDMHSSASWTVSFNRTLPIGSRAVAAGSMVLFYHPRSFTIMTYNMTDHVTTIMDKSIMYQGAAMYEEMIYLVDRARIDAYNTTDGTWRNTPLRARIRYGINLVFAARVNNAPTLLVVTFRDVVRVDPVSGTFTSLVTIGFVRSGVIHNNLMVLLFGPSKAVVNSIVIYNVRDDHRYSWQYDDYSFRYSAVAALNNTLYIANWRPNANFDSGRRLLVYNVDHSHHDFIRLKPMDYVLQYRDSMVGAHFSSQDTRVTVHDLTSAQTTEIQVNFTQRGRVLARAAADYVFFYGGELEGSTEQPLDLLVLCMQTREQWYIATVPSPYRADMVRALGNLIFFPEDTDPVIHVFDASARQWTQRTELASKTIPDMVVRTADSIVYLSTIRDTTAFDIYYAASHTWKTLDLEVGSRLHGVALVQNHLYVAGGMASNGTLLNSLIIFSLNTTNKATVHLSQPRALPAVRQLGSYIAVIGGVKDDHLRLSDVINIFQLNGEIRHNMQLQQPERLGLNFGTTTIGDSLYSRYNSNVYRFDSNAPSSTAPNPHRLLLPVMAGSAIRAVGSYLVAWGEFYNQQEFYFYDTTTPTSLHLITPLSRGVFFWRNSVILYFNGIMKIDLPVVSSLKEKTLYLPDHASWTPSAYGRGLKYSWEMRPLGQLELRIPGVAETFDIGPCQLQGGKHELSLTITDRCGLSTRVIGGVNVIPAPNVTPAGWKSDYECNSSPKLYALVEHAANPQWMIDGRSRTGDTLVLEGLTCGRTYNICVLASNPSGVTSKCKDIRINANLLKILLPIAGGLGLGLVATVVGVTRRKFMKVKKQELELKSMLSEAKREMIDSKAGKIISSTSWEWTPSDAYTYCALNQLPVTFDTSQLGFDKKHGPLDINIWFQGTIMATSKKKAKTGRLSFLHLSLLDDEHRFDIYAPQSPKFEVNVDPSSFVLSDGGAVMLTVWIKLKITTKADIQLVIVSERTRRYSSITFTVVGKPSPWIDVDDVEVSDQILGQGG
jgi:hypothetical protein